MTSHLQRQIYSVTMNKKHSRKQFTLRPCLYRRKGKVNCSHGQSEKRQEITPDFSLLYARAYRELNGWSVLLITNESTMNIEQSKKLSIIDFLDKENVTLKKKKGNAYWYLSPFRDEKTASFKVSKKENLWYDYAIKEGGDLVELVKRMYNKHSVSDALAYLASKDIATVDKAIETAIAAKEYTTTKMNDVKLLPLSNHSLLSYFSSRRIDITIGRMYCREIHYKVEQKHYYGIAFGNLSDGNEVRNPYFKGCIGHKDITLLAHTFNEWQSGCLVFEGFMDFLAYMTLVKQQDRWFVVESPCDYMILNSVANLKRALHYLDRYTHIHCFLDNDQAGRKTVESISNVFEYRVTDESFRYADYKDVNDYLMRKRQPVNE